MTEHRDVALHVRTDVQGSPDGVRRVRYIPHLKAAEAPLDDVVTLKRDIGIHVSEVARRVGDKLLRGRTRRDEAHVPRRLPRVPPAGAEPDARVGVGLLSDGAGCNEGAGDREDRSGELATNHSVPLVSVVAWKLPLPAPGRKPRTLQVTRGGWVEC